jgi:KUP system potassium uptake protein
VGFHEATSAATESICNLSAAALIPADETVPSPVADAASHADAPEPRGMALTMLSLAALGIVYGDIGTSPLYALKECFHGPHAVEAVTRTNVLGILSLIFWSLILVISVKYLVFILRADNRGEGGILALAALVTPMKAGGTTQRWLVLTLGLFGAALLYADGMITPAITVLSAVEGLGVATHFFDPFVIPITIVILIVLFYIQARGTARVGRVFGPFILVWFIVLASLGLWRIIQHPDILRAVNPVFALRFFEQNGGAGFLVLGTVFLVVTGGEALYADIGHFGIRPIRLTWFAIVLPSLLFNYFGQGALLIANLNNPAALEELRENPFYHMAPQWALYPLVALATGAAVIASQAIITGSYSLTLQAVQLGYSPRLEIRHTSHEQKGQIYLPFVNWMLMISCIGLVLGFKSSSNLAAAYGVAITVTMVITSLLFFVLVKDHWKWSLPLAVLVSAFFLVIDLSFFGANIIKVADGGWFPLLVAGAIYIMMSTWRKGRQLLGERLKRRMISVELYIAELLTNPPQRVPGIAVFMTGNPIGTPPALRHNVAHNHVLHETVIFLTVDTAERPHVPRPQRTEVEEIGEGFWRVAITYGFMDRPNIPRELSSVKRPGLEIDLAQTSYFMGRETLIATDHPGMSLWREHLFVWMSRNAQPATQFFGLPPDRVVEVGVQVEL